VATYAFHTGFVEPGLTRATRQQLDAADPRLVRRCRSTVSKLMLKAFMVSTLETII